MSKSDEICSDKSWKFSPTKDNRHLMNFKWLSGEIYNKILAWAFKMSNVVNWLVVRYYYSLICTITLFLIEYQASSAQEEWKELLSLNAKEMQEAVLRKILPLVIRGIVKGDSRLFSKLMWNFPFSLKDNWVTQVTYSMGCRLPSALRPL